MLGKALLAWQKYGGPVFLWGESLGSGVAAAVAADPPVPVEGLILMTPWDSLTDMARKQFPFLPVKWIMRDRYDSVKNLENFQKPVALVMAENDEIVPAERSQRLYQSLSAPKRKWIIQRAGHNDWLMAVDANWWRDIMAFIHADG